MPALRPGLEPEFGSAPGPELMGPGTAPGYWPPSGLAVENAQVEKALAEAEPAEGALSEGLAVELVGPLKVVGRH